MKPLSLLAILSITACQCPTVKRIQPVEVRYYPAEQSVFYSRPAPGVSTAKVVTIPARWGYHAVTP